MSEDRGQMSDARRQKAENRRTPNKEPQNVEVEDNDFVP